MQRLLLRSRHPHAPRRPAFCSLAAVLGLGAALCGAGVPRTAETLIGGFLKLIGQTEVWENIQKAKAIPRAFAWFQKAVGELKGYVGEIPGLFLAAVKSLQIEDIVILPNAFLKVGKVRR